MILTCPSCGTRYRADPASFKAPGRNVRCAKCGHTWFQTAPEPDTSTVSVVTAREADAAAEMPALSAIVTEPDGRISFNELRRRQAEASSTNGGNRLLQGVAFLVLLILLAGAGWGARSYPPRVCGPLSGSGR